MIDLDDYVARYLAQYDAADFEPLLVKIRSQQVLQSIRRHPHRRILEIGCGLDPMFLELDDYESYVVVEPSEQFMGRAKARAGSGNRITFHLAFFESVAATLQPDFDLVILSSLLHEVPDPVSLLAAIGGICRLDTVVHINVSNARSFHRLLAYEMGLINDLFEASETHKKFQRHVMFDLTTLREAVEGAGFVVLDSGSYFVKPFTNAQMAQLVKSGMLRAEMLEGLNRMTKYMPELGCEVFVDVKRR